MVSSVRSAHADALDVPSPGKLEDVVREFRAQYKTLGETVLDVLRQAILRGVFQPGQHLRQEELAVSIGVSRIPVRTALMQLDAEGLVEFQPHRGAIVRDLDFNRLQEVYQLRILLETHALRLAAETLTDADKDEIVARAETLDHADDGQGFYQERVEFYRKLYDGQRHPATVEIIEQLRAAVGRYWLGFRIKQHGGFSHRALAAAMRDGDVAAAERMLREHLERVRDQMVRITANDRD